MFKLVGIKYYINKFYTKLTNNKSVSTKLINGPKLGKKYYLNCAGFFKELNSRFYGWYIDNLIEIMQLNLFFIHDVLVCSEQVF